LETHIKEKLSVAVVGGGVAGVTAAYLLGKRHDVTLFEANGYVGGHTNTVEVADPGGRVLPIDTGFIVCNPLNYPRFYKLLDEWGVELRDSDMSFGYFDQRTGLGYRGPSVTQFLSKPANLLRLVFVRMLLEQRRFNRRALADLDGDRLDGLTLGQYLDRIDATDAFVTHYLVPLSASVWSSPDTDMLAFPARTFIRFFSNHCLLQLSRFPRWQTVVGGSHAYIKRFRERFAGTIHTHAPIDAVTRDAHGVTVRPRGGQPQRFDRVVLAAHADQSLAMLDDASDAERALLGAWRYRRNTATLHTDTSVLPPDRRVWASWNYFRRADAPPDRPVPITYWMNRLQGLDAQRDYLVSLNLTGDVAGGTLIRRIDYTHPCYTAEAVAAQPGLRALNGSNRTYFCGSYLGYGFHEDAASSAVDVAEAMGVTL